MKKYVNIIPIAIVVMGILISCEKSTDPKDFSSSVKDKSWWGTVTYADQTTEYFSVHFNTDSSLLWSQFSGDYVGKWKLNGNRLTMTFTGLSVIITADISDDNKWVDILDNMDSDVTSGEMNNFSDIKLDNTDWEGDFLSLLVYKMSFLPGSKVDIYIGTLLYPSNPYISSESSFIRISSFPNGPIFAVFTSPGELKGCISSSENHFQATKQ